MTRRAWGCLTCATWLIASCGNEQLDPEDLPLPTEPVSLGFDPKQDGFTFPNFAGPDLDAQLSPEILVQMFGEEGTCLRRHAGTCELTELASLWMQHVDRAMLGGRCEGFAVMSGLLFLGDLAPASFGADTTSALTLPGNSLLGRELAYWFSSQFFQRIAKEQTRQLSAREALGFLSRTLTDGSDLYRIGIARRDARGRLRGGHAVLPYGVTPRDDGSYEIVVYDNNHPGERRAIEIDPERDVWTYRASTNPADPEALYMGTPDDGNRMYFAPIRPRLGVQACPYCDEDAREEVTELAQMFSLGATELSVVDAEGRTSGLIGGKIVSNSPSVTVAPSFSNPLADDAPPSLLVSFDQPVRIDARATDSEATTDGFRLLGHGFAAGAQRLGPRARFILGRGGALRAEPLDNHAPRLYVARRTSAGVEITTTVAPSAPTATSFGLSIARDTGTVTLDAGHLEASFSLSLSRASAARTEPFVGTITAPPKSVVTLAVEAWPGTGAPMPGTVAVDGGPAEELFVADDDHALPRSCRDRLGSDPPPTSGRHILDPDGPGGLAPFAAYCDFETAGGGWTVVAAYTGADGEVPLTSDVEIAGDPLTFAHYNLSRAKKVALSALATESLFRRPTSWLRANAPLFDGALLTPAARVERPVTLFDANGESISAFLGFATDDIARGGDFGLSAIPFSSSTPQAPLLNPSCEAQYLYSYTALADGDAGYNVALGFGDWEASDSACVGTEGNNLALYFAMR